MHKAGDLAMDCLLFQIDLSTFLFAKNQVDNQRQNQADDDH